MNNTSNHSDNKYAQIHVHVNIHVTLCIDISGWTAGARKAFATGAALHHVSGISKRGFNRYGVLYVYDTPNLPTNIVPTNIA